VLEIDRERVLVAPAPGEPGRLPFWKADRPPRPVELGRAIGKLTRELTSAEADAAQARLVERHALDERAARNLLAYLQEQKQAAGALPDDRTLVLERTRDELGDWRLVLLSPWGGRVHAPWSLALQAQLRASGQGEVETIWSDDGIVIRVPDRERPPDAAALLPDPEEAADLVTAELGGSSLFAAYFREAAGRALLLPRRRPGQRMALWMQRKRAHDLLQVAARYGSFPIVLETFRECLQDVFDVPAFVELLRRVRRRELRLVTVDTESPSPFSASLLFGYVANYLYDGDAPLAERRAQALALDQRQLRELLGEAELRELLDPRALEEAELQLQALTPQQQLRSADRLHDLLLRIGDLSLQEIAARAESPAAVAGWLDELVRERRAIAVTLAGEARFAAAEDAGRLRDALGVPTPAGLPAAFLTPVPDALVQLVARYARTHAPFTPAALQHRYGVAEPPLQQALAELVARGRVLEGEFRPGGRDREWCDAAVLKDLRRRSLAHLRKQVEPTDAPALARLQVDWHAIDAGRASTPKRGGPDALLDVVEQIQGAVFPASDLERDILPARLPGYRPSDLDAVCAAGEVVWVGRGALGERDGRLSLFLADDLPLLYSAPLERPDGALHARIREQLERRGAVFFSELHEAAGGGMAQTTLDALWDMLWAGEITSDAPNALRSFLFAHGSRRTARRRFSAFRSRRDAPAAGVGRFSVLAARAGARPRTPTDRAAALSEQLLVLHGVLTRDAVVAADVPGGFAALYPVLAAMEEAGRIRRGYFVAGLGGSQFAEVGALERLRALRETSATPEEVDLGVLPACVLAATDPANAYGAALPWPKDAGTTLQRAAGAHVVLVDGALAAYMTKGEGALVLRLPEEEPRRAQTARAVALALGRWAALTGRATLAWAAETGEPASRGPLQPYMAEAGFVASGPGYRLAR
jgi:ATP-dependent Lhr-like helicase